MSVKGWSKPHAASPAGGDGDGGAAASLTGGDGDSGADARVIGGVIAGSGSGSGRLPRTVIFAFMRLCGEQ